MIFSRKNAGKWVASKDGKIIATSTNLERLVKKMSDRRDKHSIGYDIVPKYPFFAGHCGACVH